MGLGNITFIFSFYKFLLLIFFCIFSNVSIAHSDNVKTADQIKAAERLRIASQLLVEKKYEEAWTILEKLDDETNPTLLFHKGLLLGGNVLKDGENRCEAVKNFEKMEELGAIYVRPFLDHLYYGDWITIAVIEGNRIALYEKALQILKSTKKSNPFLFYNENLKFEDGIFFLEQSRQQGFHRADRKMKKLQVELGSKYKDIFESAIQKNSSNMGYKSVYCDIRKYKD